MRQWHEYLSRIVYFFMQTSASLPAFSIDLLKSQNFATDIEKSLLINMMAPDGHDCGAPVHTVFSPEGGVSSAAKLCLPQITMTRIARMKRPTFDVAESLASIFTPFCDNSTCCRIARDEFRDCVAMV